MINVLVPSRGRPHELTQMYQSLIDTCVDPAQTQLVLGLDIDDVTGIKAAHGLRGSVGVKLEIGERRNDLSAYYNCLHWTAADRDIYQLAADDIRYKTPGWDQRVRAAFEAYEDRIALVWTRDRLNADNPLDCATHPFLHWNWIEAVGYLVPPAFCRCIDVWLMQIAVRLGRDKYLPDVFIHSPTRQERSEVDQTLMDLDARIGTDNRRFAERKAEQMADLEKLKKVIGV